MRISSIRRLGLLICLLTAASGCSIKLAYNNLDRLVLWQVGDYVRLDREQKAYLRQEVDTLLYWHRRNHLPLYADYMRTLAVTLTDAPQVSHIDAMFEQFLAWGEEVEQRVAACVTADHPCAAELKREADGWLARGVYAKQRRDCGI